MGDMEGEPAKPNTFRETKSGGDGGGHGREHQLQGEMCLCTSSRENRMPAMGALKAADRPAPAPQVISTFLGLDPLGQP